MVSHLNRLKTFAAQRVLVLGSPELRQPLAQGHSLHVGGCCNASPRGSQGAKQGTIVERDSPAAAAARRQPASRDRR